MDNILLIGACGFIGKNILKKIKPNIHNNVYALGSKYKRQTHQDNFIETFIANKNRMKIISFIMKNDIKIIINAAGVVGDNSYGLSDVELASEIVELISMVPWKLSLIHVGSSAEYEALDYGNKTTENTKVKPISTYGEIKRNASNYFIEQSEIYKFKLVVLRIFNVIGVEMNTSTILGKLYNEVFVNNRITVEFGDLKGYRDYIDVRDVALAVTRVVDYINQKKNTSKIYNIGSGKAIQMLSLLDLIVDESNNRFSYVSKINDEYRGMFWQEADISLVMNELEWKPTISIIDSVKMFVRNYNNVK